MITIRVIDNRGQTVSGADVHISWPGWTHSRGRTDGRGEVSFDVSSGNGKILVNGQSVYDDYISGTVTVRERS